VKITPQVQNSTKIICTILIIINFSCTKQQTYKGQFLCFDLSIEKNIKDFGESEFVKTAYLSYFDDSQYGQLTHFIIGKKCDYRGKDYDLDFETYFLDKNFITMKVFANNNINLYESLIKSEVYNVTEEQNYFLLAKENNDYKIILYKNSFNKCIIFPAEIEISKLIKLQIIDNL
jgi:hypothetical protein